jgi:hypothetical protein
MARPRRHHRKSSRKFGLVKNTVSTVKNVGDKSINGVKDSVGEVVELLKSGTSLTMDGFHTGMKNTSRFLTKKPRTKKYNRGKKRHTRRRKY